MKIPSISKLFTLKSVQTTPTDQTADLNNRGSLTYQQWGTKCAGLTQASITAITPCLQNVVIVQKKEQQGDETMMQAARAQVQAQVRNVDLELDQLAARINQTNQATEGLKDQIAANQRKIVEIQNSDNKSPIAKVYFWISTTIVVLLAFYLFIFYSSASFSAFFGSDQAASNGLSGEIFNPRAFELALQNGVMTMFFILLMPMIFLGLGFLIHIYAQKQGKVKYLKIAALYTVTFVFDALLAYKISEKFFMPTEENPTYTMGQAFNSPDFWIVIFAGFIAYVICGLVFDSAMDAYQDMVANKSAIRQLEHQNNRANNQIEANNNLVTQLQNKQLQMQQQRNNLEVQLANKFVYNVNRILLELNNFFRGWLAYMTAMDMGQDEQNKAKDALQAVQQSLLPQAITTTQSVNTDQPNN